MESVPFWPSAHVVNQDTCALSFPTNIVCMFCFSKRMSDTLPFLLKSIKSHKVFRFKSINDYKSKVIEFVVIIVQNYFFCIQIIYMVRKYNVVEFRSVRHLYLGNFVLENFFKE